MICRALTISKALRHYHIMIIKSLSVHAYAYRANLLVANAAGKPTTERAVMAISGDKVRAGLCVVLRIASTLLVGATLVMRAAEQFYVVPFHLPAGNSVTGLKLDTQMEWMMVVGSAALFLAGTWAIRRRGYALLAQAGSMLGFVLYDVKTMWYWLSYWGPEKAELWISDFPAWAEQYTLPAFGTMVVVEAAACVLCVMQFALSRQRHQTSQQTLTKTHFWPEK